LRANCSGKREHWKSHLCCDSIVRFMDENSIS
jgi:hypothetical protein